MKNWITTLILFVSVVVGFTLLAREDERARGEREKRENAPDRENPRPRGDRERENPERHRNAERDRPRPEGKREGERGNRERDAREGERRPDEHHLGHLKEKAAHLERFIESLEQSGKEEEANQARRQLQSLHQQIARMHQHERRDGARPGFNGRAEGRPPAVSGNERMQHAMDAVRNLEAAGMHDLAQVLRKRLQSQGDNREDRERQRPEGREREHPRIAPREGAPREGRPPFRPDPFSNEGSGNPQMHQVIRDLQRQLLELQKQVQALRRE